MRIQSDTGRRASAAIGLAVLLLSMLAAVHPAPARAASSVSLEVRPLVAGRYEVNGWAALAVTLVNEGVPTDGWVVAETSAGASRRFVEMPSGARKVVMLYVRPEAFQREIEVRYEEPNGTVRSTTELRVLEQSNDQVAIVGDPTGVLRPQLVPVDGSQRPEPLSLVTGDLPDRPEPLAGLSVIVWAADSSSLTEEQRRSLERWIADGGQLVVVGGPDWQARAAGFTDLLPTAALASLDGVTLSSLATWAGADAPAVEEATVSTGALRDDARPLVTADDGTVLASMRAVGAGRVVLLGVDFAAEPYRGWEGSARLWGRLIPGDALAEWMGGGPDLESRWSAMSDALTNLPELEVPPAELLLVVVAGYILLIGPISYAVLRRFDRRELAWVTAPLLVVLFTGTSFGIGLAMKGSDVIVNQITVVRTAAEGGVATVETYAGVFSPTRATYDLRVDADALVAAMDTSFGLADQRSGEVSEQGNPARLRGLSVSTAGFQVVRADGVTEHEPALSVTWRTEAGDLVGTVTNLGDEPLSDVAYISVSGGEMVGDLGPGESGEFTVDQLNLNGSAASDQVYGFGGFDPNNTQQRRIAARRSVINALVGYGGGFPVVDGGLASFDGRGPFVIGWRSGDGPMPFDLEGGPRPQRYGETVEVVGVRPLPASGEVTIGPGQMSVVLVETEGQVESVGPGMTTIGQGSATFSIALPLEMSGIAVSEVEIVVGPDPSMVFQQPGDFVGFWQPGITAQVLDARTGEWRVLGDISQGSSFEIDDPESVVSGGGRIEVRFVGSEEIDPNFGIPSVYVSARVSGVLDR
ncbi:MAG TPA: hypothetical protein VHR55_08860 [Candidatus Limnocylindria bacterium]|nr:hypothetical protein [Candidatus Limnocylindria bacterium]